MQIEPRKDALVGTVLEGAYRITRLIGEGGMGAVYEAVQLRLAKRVAVKLMARHLAADEKALARFHREAEITSHLGHPHLVAVVDYGQAESGEPYLVMEYLEGEDLDHRLRRVGRMPIESVVPVVRQVASALSAAHTHGIVHRDLKPGNIFLVQIPGEPDFVKVLDFGVSKIMAARTRLTNASSAVGTPAYMSPEQATGLVEEIDHHVDQWALACIAWEMLLGHPPFAADDVTALLFQIIKMDPHPLTPRVPGLAPGVELELRQALAKRPADRFPSIREFSHAFEYAALGRPVDLTPEPVQVMSATPSGAILDFDETQVSKMSATPLAPQKPSEEHVSVAAATPVTPVGIKPVHAIIAGAAGVLLLIGAFLLFRSKPAPEPGTTDTSNPVATPMIVVPIRPTPAPPAIVPEAAAVQPEVRPGLGDPTSPRSEAVKTAKPTLPARREKAKRPTSGSKTKRQLIKQL